MTYRRILLPALLPFFLACQIQENTSPASFEELLASFDRLSPKQRQQRIASYIASNGPTPVVEGDEAIFVAQGEPSTPPRILGDFNAWGRNDDGPVESAGMMTSVDGTNWYYLRRSFREDARIEYAIVYGDERRVDPHNPTTTLGIEKPVSELAMPAYESPPEFSEDGSIPRGRVTESIFESQILSNERKILVY